MSASQQGGGDNRPVQDHYTNEYHRIIISGASKEKLLETYAQWAPTYDAFARTVECPHIIADKLVGALKTLMPATAVLNVLDAGCGTGYPGDVFKKLANEQGLTVRLTGLDYSSDMLEQSAKYVDTFAELHEVDLMQPLPFAPASFDAWFACAVLADGHCGPEILPNIAAVMRPGSVGVVSVRRKTYDARKDLYDSLFQQSEFDTVGSDVAPYGAGIEAYYFILRKK